MTERRRPMRRLSDLLPSVASQLGFEAELQLALAMSSWERLVAEHVPAAAGATGKLTFVHARNSAPNRRSDARQQRSSILLREFARNPRISLPSHAAPAEPAPAPKMRADGRLDLAGGAWRIRW